MDLSPIAIAGILFGLLVTVTCIALCVRVYQRRKKRKYNFGLDPDEKRFKKRLEATTALGFSANEDADQDLELTSKEIEQLQALEVELARRATGSQANANRGGGGGGGGGRQQPAGTAPRTTGRTGSAEEGDTVPLVAPATAAARGAGPAAADELDAAIQAVALGAAEDTVVSMVGGAGGAGVRGTETSSKKGKKAK